MQAPNSESDIYIYIYDIGNVFVVWDLVAADGIHYMCGTHVICLNVF